MCISVQGIWRYQTQRESTQMDPVLHRLLPEIVSATRLSQSPVPSKALSCRADGRSAAAFPWKLPGSRHRGQEPVSVPALLRGPGERRWDTLAAPLV